MDKIIENRELSNNDIKQNMEGWKFIRCRFNGLDLSQVDFTDARFEYCSFAGATLVDTKFTHASIWGSGFDNTVAIATDFTATGISECRFRETDLRRSLFVNACVTRSDFAQADIEGAKFRFAYGLHTCCFKQVRGFWRADFYQTNIAHLEPWTLERVKEVCRQVVKSLRTGGLHHTARVFGLWLIPGEPRALVALREDLAGGYCIVPRRRQIWWWDWRCPSVPEVLYSW